MQKIVFILGLLSCLCTFGQTIQWEQNYGGTGRELLLAMQQTSDGGYVMGGLSYSSDTDVGDNNGSSDFWLVKTDAVGNIEWEQNYGGPDWDFLFSLEQANDGGYILAGQTHADGGDVSQFNAINDYWVVKTDPLGNIEWEQSYGGSMLDFLGSVIQTTDGGYLLGGETLSDDGNISQNNGDFDCWLVKIDALGNIQWEQNYGGTDSERLLFNSIEQTVDGGYIMAATSRSTDGDVSQNLGGDDFWLVKIDALGSIEWEQTYGDSFSENLNTARQTADGGYILAGSVYSITTQSSNAKVIKTDNMGNVEWEQEYGGSNDDKFCVLEITEDSGYLLGGWTQSSDGDFADSYGEADFWLVKIDANGRLQWEQNYGGLERDELRALQLTKDGNIALAGSTMSNNIDVGNNYGDWDFWFLKLTIEDCLEVLETADLGREGALAATEYNLAATPNTSYTWYNENNEVVAEFTGTPYFSPNTTGTYYVEIENEYGVCQTLGPRTITTLDGCCELEETEEE